MKIKDENNEIIDIDLKQVDLEKCEQIILPNLRGTPWYDISQVFTKIVYRDGREFLGKISLLSFKIKIELKKNIIMPFLQVLF